jgi:hypothetical protein
MATPAAVSVLAGAHSMLFELGRVQCMQCACSVMHCCACTPHSNCVCCVIDCRGPAAAGIVPYMYTYGAPRVGNKVCNRCLRSVHAMLA